MTDDECTIVMSLKSLKPKLTNLEEIIFESNTQTVTLRMRLLTKSQIKTCFNKPELNRIHFRMEVWILFSLTLNIFRLIDLNFHGCVEHTLEWISLQFVEFRNQNHFECVHILMVEQKVICLSKCFNTLSHFQESWLLTLNQ